MKNLIEKSKGIMKKQTVMIILLVVALFFTALYIGVLARPISYGMAYSGSIAVEGETSIDATIKFKNSEVMVISASGEEQGQKVEMEVEFFIITNGNKFMPVGIKGDGTGDTITQEEYDTIVAGLKADKEAWDAVWAEGEGVATINAFSTSNTGEDLTCNGAIAFAVVMGVVTVVSIIFAGLSLNLYIKDRKAGPQTVAADEHPDKNEEQGAN